MADDVLLGCRDREVEDRGEAEGLRLRAIPNVLDERAKSAFVTVVASISYASSATWCSGASPSAGLRSPDESPIVKDPAGMPDCSIVWRPVAAGRGSGRTRAQRDEGAAPRRPAAAATGLACCVRSRQFRHGPRPASPRRCRASRAARSWPTRAGLAGSVWRRMRCASTDRRAPVRRWRPAGSPSGRRGS